MTPLESTRMGFQELALRDRDNPLESAVQHQWKSKNQHLALETINKKRDLESSANQYARA